MSRLFLGIGRWNVAPAVIDHAREPIGLGLLQRALLLASAMARPRLRGGLLGKPAVAGFARLTQVDDVTHQRGTAMRMAWRASRTVTGVRASTSPSIEIGKGGSVSIRNCRPRNSRTVPRT